MTQIAIQKQVEAIIQVTKEARKTKESARQFLVDAGILKDSKAVTPNTIAQKK
jgi:hypothetical protein